MQTDSKTKMPALSYGERKYFLNYKLRRLKYVLFFCVIAIWVCSCTSYKTITYKEDESDFLNPERGFYIPAGTKASSFIPLDAAVLRTYRDIPQQQGKATYKVQVSLIYRGYELDIFKDKPLSDGFLNNLQKDFDAVRTAGLKIIIRFAYTNTATSGVCKDEYKICPPYGDAPVRIVFQHIEQLKPLLQKNADVIAVMQEGFIGIWGENYFTDYFGDASTNGVGRIADSSWQLRNELLKRLLDALPAGRMIQVRTPQIKQKFVYGVAAKVSCPPLQLQDAFNGTDASRIGFHNDCFLSTPDDYGTYYDYGSSKQPRQPANEILRKYIEADTKFTAVGGETCDDAFSPQNDCAPAGYAEDELRRMHYSYLNAAYNNDVNNDWDSAGCLMNIKKNLGYRFVLRSIKVPQSIGAKQTLPLEMQIENSGYASPFNERPAYVVLRHTSTKREHTIQLKTDIRFLSTGLHQAKEQVQLPGGIPAGKYRLFLFLPDTNLELSKRPEYCLRLANTGIWEPQTGYNHLNSTITVK